MLCNQSAFDIIARHLFKQGEQSTSTSDSCMYRDPKGLMCAVGVLIPDSLYHKNMDMNGYGGIRVQFIIINHPDLGEFFKGIDIELLEDLQLQHDEPSSWQSSDEMRKGLKIIAKRFNLDPTVLYEEGCKEFKRENHALT